jgi:hypothetical protein
MILGANAAESWTRFSTSTEAATSAGRLNLAVARTGGGVLITVNGPASTVPVSVLRAETLESLLRSPEVSRTAPYWARESAEPGAGPSRGYPAIRGRERRGFRGR